MNSFELTSQRMLFFFKISTKYILAIIVVIIIITQPPRRFNFIYFYLFTFGCVGSSFLCEGFLQLRQVGATLHRGARASHYRGLSCCRAQAPDVQAQQLRLMGLVTPWHVGSSQTRA